MDQISVGSSYYWFQVQSPVRTGMLVIEVSNWKWDCVVPVLR